jgi:hypothetical protein
VATGKADWMKTPIIVGSPAKCVQLIDICVFCAQLKCLFYMLSVMLEDELSQTNGMLFLADLRDLPFQNGTNMNIRFDRKFMKLLFEMIRASLPISINALHTCRPAEKSLTAIVLPFTLWFMGKDMRVRRIEHFGEPPVLLSSLEEYGLKKEGIPAALGGTWNEFGNWTTLRLQLELERERNEHA